MLLLQGAVSRGKDRQLFTLLCNRLKVRDNVYYYHEANIQGGGKNVYVVFIYLPRSLL